MLNRGHQVTLLRISVMMAARFQSSYIYSSTTAVCGQPSFSKTFWESNLNAWPFNNCLDLIWNCLLSLLAILTVPFNLLQKSSTRMQCSMHFPNTIARIFQSVSFTVTTLARDILAENSRMTSPTSAPVRTINAVIIVPFSSREFHCSIHQGWQGNPDGSDCLVST